MSLINFELSNADTDRIDEFERMHDCPLRTNEYGIEGEIYVGPIGGNLTFSFTPTGLGVIAKVRCSCGAELDLTDYESW